MRAEQSGYEIKDLRLMLGRSDSAMIYGMVASVLAVKGDYFDCCATGNEHGVEIYPIFGGGVLPFRGHVSLDNFERLISDFAGIRTVTVQSGLRYDCDSEAARQVAIKAHDLLPGAPPLAYSNGSEMN